MQEMGEAVGNPSTKQGGRKEDKNSKLRKIESEHEAHNRRSAALIHTMT